MTEIKKITIVDFKELIKEKEFEEYPYTISGKETPLSELINYNDTSLELKIYLCKLVIKRCFSPTGGIFWPMDTEWFINNFFVSYESDKLKSWLTATIREAVEMILSEDTFTKGIIGTTFMFGIVEFYAKYELGFRPFEYDFFDDKKKDYFRNITNKKGTKHREISIGTAISLLQEKHIAIANSLNEIDEHNIARLKEFEIEEHRYVFAKISDRLNLARNTMLHGENHSFYDKGELLVMLYILFDLHRT
jgi:hypothetical protein